jgi:hypothetical protein
VEKVAEIVEHVVPAVAPNSGLEDAIARVAAVEHFKALSTTVAGALTGAPWY